MDWTLDSTFLCSCGKSFSQPGRLTFHQKSCKKGKRRLADAFEKARESWRQRKRLQVEDLTASHIEASQQSPSGVIANSVSFFLVEIAHTESEIIYIQSDSTNDSI